MPLFIYLALVLAYVSCVPPPAVTADGPTIAPGYPPSLTGGSGPTSDALEAMVADMKSPGALSNYLLTYTEWRDDYDTGIFLKPAGIADWYRTVCSGFASFWQYAFARHGIRGEFVAF